MLGGSAVGKYINSSLNDSTKEWNQGLEVIREGIFIENMNFDEIEIMLYELNSSTQLIYDIEYSNLDMPKEKFESISIEYPNELAFVYNEFLSNQHGQYVVSVQSRRGFNAIIILIITTVILFIIFFLVSFTIFVSKKEAYLRKIAAGIDKLSSGDLDLKIPVKGKDEIAFVATNINLMSRSLQLLIEKERLSEKTKNELIANVSHDLRTPLTSITGFLALIEDNHDIDEEKRNKYIQIALKNAMGLNELIEQLFAYVTLSNMKEKIITNQINMNTFLEQLTFEYVAMLSENGYIVKEQNLMNPDSNPKCRINPELIKRVFDNLNSNILKHGSRNGSVIMMRKLYDEVIYITISNEISDSEKMGISENIFDRYFTTNRNCNESGGLGLAISKEIILKHNGKISALYEKNRFIIEIQLPIIK